MLYLVKRIFIAALCLSRSCIYTNYTVANESNSYLSKSKFNEVVAFKNNELKEITEFARTLAEQSKKQYAETVKDAEAKSKQYQAQLKDEVRKAENNLSDYFLEHSPSKDDGELDKMLSDYSEIQKSSKTSSNKERLYIFVSLSIPKAVLVELDKQAKLNGGKLVLRGFKNNSFQETIKAIGELKEGGITLDIEPKVFEQFDVIQVPAFVVSDGSKFDKITGNISLNYALEKFASEGDLKIQAHNLLRRVS